MNSLTELNGYSNQTIDYIDLRPAQIIYQPNGLFQPVVNTLEGSDVRLQYKFNITELVNYQNLDFRYVIILNTGAPTVTINFGTLPTGITRTDTTISGKTAVILNGFTSAAQFESVKDPLIIMPNDYFGSWSYEVRFASTGALTTIESWTVTLNVADIDALSTPTDFNWNSNASNLITGNPIIIDTGTLTPTYTVTVTPSNLNTVVSLSSAGTGGTSTYNTGTKVLTIVGTKTQVNSHLNSITFVASTTEQDFNMTYFLSNNLTTENDTKVQFMNCFSIEYISALGQPIFYYQEDIAQTVVGNPTITDLAYTGNDNYTFTITPGVAAAVSTWATSTASTATATINPTTKRLTLIGNKTQVNLYLSGLVFTPAPDYIQNINIFYSVTTPSGNTATKLQPYIVQVDAQEVSNISQNRQYVKNNPTFIFRTTNYRNTSGASQTLTQTLPQITDQDPNNPSYTVQITVPVAFGYITLGDSIVTQTTLSYTGTRGDINTNFFPFVKVWPYNNYTANTTLTYRQFKNGVEQVFTSIGLSAITNAVYSGEVIQLITASTTSYSPPTLATLYGNTASVMLVGGGGGGAQCGGGGGAITEAWNINIPAGTYSITIGSGGAGRTGVPQNINNTSYITNRWGGITSAFGYTARGGGSGLGHYNPSNSGTSTYAFLNGGEAGRFVRFNAGSFVFKYNPVISDTITSTSEPYSNIPIGAYFFSEANFDGNSRGGAGTTAKDVLNRNPGDSGYATQNTTSGAGGTGYTSPLNNTTYARGGTVGAANANPNTGAGGGGTGFRGGTGGNGGSGIVVIKYHGGTLTPPSP